MTVLIITHLAAMVIAALITWAYLRRAFFGLEAEHDTLLREYDDLAIAHGLLTDRDELGRFKK